MIKSDVGSLPKTSPPSIALTMGTGKHMAITAATINDILRIFVTEKSTMRLSPISIIKSNMYPTIHDREQNDTSQILIFFDS